jgi:hypothetical protein
MFWLGLGSLQCQAGQPAPDTVCGGGDNHYHHSVMLFFRARTNDYFQ